MKSTGWILILTALLIGILGGWVGAQATHHTSSSVVAANASNSNMNGINEAFNSQATNIRLSLNNLLREHTTLGSGALIALLDGVDTTRADQLLQDNEQQLATIFGNVYGKDFQNKFTQLWSQHIQEYKNYTLAKKNNDTAKMNQARQNLQSIAKQMGALFAASSSNLSASTVTNLMNQHITDTLGVVDAAAQGNSTQVTNMAKAGYDQAGQFADTLARGMIMDKPTMFE